MPPGKTQLIRTTGKRLRDAVRSLVRSEQGGAAVACMVLLLVLMVLINVLNVTNSYVGRDFMSAIENKDFPGFQQKTLLYALVFIASTITASVFRYTEERLGILWREQLTWRLTSSYLSDRTYHHLDASTGVANPDQRIAEDVKAFTTTTLSFLLLILNGTITAISFSGVLWSISPMLFAVAVAYAVFGSFFTVMLGKPLIRINYHQFDMEANFRADLIHVRENSESIALAHREGRFKIRLKKRLDALTRNFRRLIVVNRNLSFFTNGYNYFIQIIPVVLIAPMYMSGDVKFGVITQSAMAFATLLGAFSLIVTQFQSISAFTAVTARLHLLGEAITRAEESNPCRIVVEDRGDRLIYQDVSLQSADRTRTLIEGLSWEIPPATCWLVTAEDDAAGIALFRATAGVWDCGTGRMIRPGPEEVLFLAERPYLPPGPLRDAIIRAGHEGESDDAAVFTVLRSLGIEEAVQRVGGLNAEKDWDEELSIGEQHLLSVARILLAKPAFVFLDRPGSAMPKAMVASVIQRFREEGLGVVVFGRNGERSIVCDGRLTIGRDGTWAIAGHEPDSPGDPDLSC